MTVYDIVSLNRELLKRLHKNGIKVNDYKWLDLYNDYLQMKADGDKEMRENMRQQMRGGYRRNVQMRRNATDQYKEGYRNGYKAGYLDGSEDESTGMTEHTRERNSRGRFM